MAFRKIPPKILELEADKELRVEINNTYKIVTLELLDGIAEICGVEMLKNKINTFSSSFAVSTWVGCVLKFEGFAKFKTVSKKRVIYDLHVRLEENRMKAQQERCSGPIVLIAGPKDVGKSTLTHHLINYASGAGRQPIFIDLDVGQSSVSIPGTLCVLPVDEPVDIVKGYNNQKASVYFFGYNSPRVNRLLYLELISKLGKTLYRRLENSPNERSSGAIIDTCGWVTDQGYEAIIHAAKSFRITTLIILDDETLYSSIEDDVPDSVDKIFVNKLDGVVPRDKRTRKERRANLVSEYFFGRELSIKPSLIEVNYSEIEIIKIECSSSYANRDMHLSITKVPLNFELIDQVLGISYADTLDQNVITKSVLGFVCVEDVNLERNTIKILSPKDAPLPKKILILGDIKRER